MSVEFISVVDRNDSRELNKEFLDTEIKALHLCSE